MAKWLGRNGEVNNSLNNRPRVLEEKKAGGFVFLWPIYNETMSARQFVTSIAFQLASASASLKELTCAQLENSRNIKNHSFRDRWRRFI
jgi:hypothetical protein